jgi:hypothetical protein
MIYDIIKILISALLITAISEISKRSTLWGGILASIPFVSVIAFIWLYTETKSVEKISQLSTSVFWLVIPSLSMFLILPYLLKLKLDFYLALLVSIVVMILCYYAMIFILAKFGVKI